MPMQQRHFRICLHIGALIGNDGTHLKALYTGLYQQTKEQGVKRRAHRMASPRPTPPCGSTMNIASEETRLKSRVAAQTGGRPREQGVKEESTKSLYVFWIVKHYIVVIHGRSSSKVNKRRNASHYLPI